MRKFYHFMPVMKNASNCPLQPSAQLLKAEAV